MIAHHHGQRLGVAVGAAAGGTVAVVVAVALAVAPTSVHRRTTVDTRRTTATATPTPTPTATPTTTPSATATDRLAVLEEQLEVPPRVVVEVQVGSAEGRHGFPHSPTQQTQGAKYKGDVFLFPQVGRFEAVEGRHAEVGAAGLRGVGEG